MLQVAVVAVLFGRRVRYFLHDFHHLFPRGLGRFQSIAVAAAVLLTPVLLRLGLVPVLLVLFGGMALYRSMAERAGGDGQRLPSDPERLRTELARYGFTDVESAARRVAEWRSGRPRSLRSTTARDAFEAMLPKLLKAIAGGRDPNHALAADFSRGLAS
jgi:hypothetical protein